MVPSAAPSEDEVREATARVMSDGYALCRGALDSQFVTVLRNEVDRVFREAKVSASGPVARGPQRWYLEVHPETIEGFIEVAAHPWVSAVAESILGRDYRIVEFGFDIPFPGAELQPWHRDFPMPSETRDDQRLTSLAFNIPLVTISEDMVRLEIVPGTQFDIDDSFSDRQFPPAASSADYETNSIQLAMDEGDVSARSALAIHRGRPNRSDQWRPMLVIGMDDPTANNSAHHDLAMSRSFWNGLSSELQSHFDCPIADVLPPLVQHHLIDGLLEPDTADDESSRS